MNVTSIYADADAVHLQGQPPAAAGAAGPDAGLHRPAPQIGAPAAAQHVAAEAAAPRTGQALPAYRIPRDIAAPGHLELDLAHHSGPVTQGEYVYALQPIDVATWLGRAPGDPGAQLHRGGRCAGLSVAQLPFPGARTAPHNGSEPQCALAGPSWSASLPPHTARRQPPGLPE